MTIYKISLERIQANPWQTRSKAPAAEYIKELALDIAANGMLQTPMGRILTYTRQVVDHLQLEGPGGAGGYLGENKGAALQLAFGHNRLAAYRWLCLRDRGVYPVGAFHSVFALSWISRIGYPGSHCQI